MGYNCINHKDPNVDRFFTKLSEKLDIDKADLIGNGHFLNASNVAPISDNASIYEEFFNFVFYRDKDNAVFFLKEDIENSYNPTNNRKLTVDDFKEQVKALKNLVEAYNHSARPGLDEANAIKKEAFRLGIPIKTYKNAKGKVQLALKNAVIQEGKTGKAKKEFDAAQKAYKAKADKLYLGSSPLDAMHRTLSLALQMFGTEVIKSPNFEKDHTYYRKRRKGEESSMDDIQINGQLWTPVDASVTSLDRFGIIKPKEDVSGSLAIKFGNANDMVMRAYFAQHAGYTKEEKLEGKQRLDLYLKNGIHTNNAKMSKESVKEIVGKMSSIIAAFDTIYGKGKWRAWSNEAPLISKFVMKEGKQLKTMYIAGEFDLLIYDSAGKIHPYDFKSGEIYEESFTLQLGRYAAMLDTNPLLAGRMDTRASVIRTEMNYANDSNTPQIKNITLVNLDNVAEKRMSMDDLSIFGLDEELLIDQKSGSVYSPRSITFKSLLQRQRDALNNGRDIVSARERLQAAHFIGKSILSKIHDYMKRFPNAGGEIEILNKYRHTIISEVFRENFSPNNIEDPTIKAKRSLIFNNSLAMLEYVENYFRNLTGMSLFYDYRQISDKMHNTFLEQENSDIDIREEQRVDDLWRIGDAVLQSANLTLSKELRKEFALMEDKGSIDSFGNKVYIDEKAAFNELRKILDGCLNLDDMIMEIENLDDTTPYKYALLDKLKDSEAKNSSFRSSFYNGFRMQSITYSAVRLVKNDDGTYEFKNYIVNLTPVHRDLLNNAREAFANSPDLVANLIESLENTGNKLIALQKKPTKNMTIEDLSVIARALTMLGFKSNIITENNLIQALSDIQRHSTAKSGMKVLLANLVGNKKTEGLLEILERGYANNDYYNPFASKNTDAVQKFMSIAHILSPRIKESVELTAYENGKTYYSYSSPSYISNLCDALSYFDFERTSEFVKNEYGKYAYFYDSANGDERNAQYRNVWLRYIIGQKELLESKRQLNFNKVEYEDLGEGAYALSLLAEYGNDNAYAWYAVPTLSNKGTSLFLKFRKFDIKDNSSEEDIKTFVGRDLFMQEAIQILQVFQAAVAGKSRIENYSLSNDDWAKEALQHYKEHKLTVTDIKNMFKAKKHGAKFGFLSFLNSLKDPKDASLIIGYMKEFLNKEGGGIKNEGLIQEKVGDLFEAEMDKQFTEYKDTLKKLGVFMQEEISDPFADNKKKPGKVSVPKYLIGLLGENAVRKIIKEAKDQGHRDYIRMAQNRIDKEIDEYLKDYFWNSTFANINIIQLTSTSISFYKNMEEFQKRNAQILSPKQMLDKSAFWTVNGEKQKFSADGMMRGIVVNDETVIAETYSMVEAIFDEMLSSLSEESPEYAVVSRSRKQALNALQDVVTTDGQAFDSPTSYRKKTGMTGQWRDEDEEIYNSIIKGEKPEKTTSWEVKKPFVYGSTQDNLIRIMQQFKNSEKVILLSDALLRAAGRYNKLTALFDFMENTAYKGRTVVREGYEYTDGIKGKESNKPDGTIINVGTYTGKGIDTVLFKSNVKHSVRNTIDLHNLTSYEDIITALNNFAFINNDYNPENVDIMDFDSYGIQQPVPDHYIDEESLIGSQMRILSVSGITPGTVFDAYSLTISDKKKNIPTRIGARDYDDLVQEYQELHAKGIKDSVNMLRRELLLDKDAIKDTISSAIRHTNYRRKIRGASPAYKYFSDAINKLVTKKIFTEEQGKSLINTAKALIKSNNLIYQNIENANPFLKAPISKQTRDAVLSELLKESVLKDTKFGVDLLEAFELNEKGEFKVPLGESMHSIKVQQLLNSIIRDRIWKQKAPGGPIVQVAGYDADLNIRFINSNGEYAKTLAEFEGDRREYVKYLRDGKFRLAYFEVLAPVPSIEVEQALIDAGKKYSQNFFLNPMEAVKKGIITEEMLKLIGYRIPTEDKYSMFPMKIVGFLPRQSGESIIMPKDITAIAGLDFDVDKLYTIRKHFYAKTASDSINTQELREYIYNMLNEDPEMSKTSHTVRARVNNIIISDAEKILKEEEIAENVIDDEDEIPEVKQPKIHEEYRKFIESVVEEVTANPELYKAVRKFKDNSVSFNKDGRYDFEKTIKNKAKRQNRIFDIQWASLTSRESTEQMFNPQSFDNLVKIGYIISIMERDKNASYEALQKMTTSELEDVAENSVGHIIYPQTTMYFQHANTVANTMVGIFANQNISHAFVSLPNINITYDPLRDFTLGNVTVKGKVLDPLKSFGGVYVNKNIASFLAAAVDAAKKNALAPIGINKDTVNVAGLLLRIGFDPEIVSLFISQPIIKEVVRKHEELSLSGYTTFQRAAAEVLKEHNKYKEYSDVSPVNVQDDSYTDANTFSEKTLAKEISNRDSMTPTQFRVLHLFSQLLGDAESLSNITFATKFNSRSNSTGPTLAETIILKRKYNSYYKMMHPISTELAELIPFKGDDVFAKSPLLNAFFEASIGPDGLINAVFKDYFPHLSKAVYSENSLDTGIINKIIEMVPELNAKDISKIISHLEYYVLTSDDIYDKTEEEKRRMVFNTDPANLYLLLTTFPDRVAKFKKNHSEEKRNLVLESLIVNRENATAKFPVVEMRTSHLGKENIDDFKADWEELANPKNEQNWKFMKDLISYMLLVNGFAYSPKTGLHNTPVFVKFLLGMDKQGDYIDSIRKVTTQADTYLSPYAFFKFDNSDFIVQFFRNNSTNRKFVTKIFKQEDYHLFINKENEVSPRGNIENWKEYIDTYGNPPIWFLYNNTLFFNRKYDTAENPEYITFSPLGVTNTVVEYNSAQEIEESIIDSVRDFYRKKGDEVVNGEEEGEESTGTEETISEDPDVSKILKDITIKVGEDEIYSPSLLIKQIQGIKTESEYQKFDKIIRLLEKMGEFEEEDLNKMKEQLKKTAKEKNIC